MADAPILAPNQVNVGTADAPNVRTAAPIGPDQANVGTQTSPVIVTAAPATSQFNQNTSYIQGIMNSQNQPGISTAADPSGTGRATLDNTNDAYTQALGSMNSSQQAATTALLNSIQAQRATQGQQVDAQYANYKAGLQALGIEHNEAQFSPDLLTAHVNAAENEHQQKITQLNTESNKALMDAEAAQSKNDFDTLDKKVAYIKDLNQQKQDYLKNIADNLNNEKTINADFAGQIYDQLQNLPADQQEPYLQQVASQYASQGVSLGGLTQAVAAQKASLATAALKTATDQAALAHTDAETRKLLSDSSTGPVLTQEHINSINKANPLVNLYYGASKADGIAAVSAAHALQKNLSSFVANPANLYDGKLKAADVKTTLASLPDGVDRAAVLKLMQPYLSTDFHIFGGSKIDPGYGLTDDDISSLSE